jgi:cytoskeletal protein RodZ
MGFKYLVNLCPKGRGFLMKKYISIIISILLCLLLVGCSANVQGGNENSITSTTASTLKASDEEESTTAIKANSTTTSETTTSNKETTKSTTTTTKNQATTKSNTTSSSTTTKATTKKSTTTSTTAKATAKQTTKAKTTTTTTTSSTITCTVSIECKSILSNMNNLKAGHEAYVPSNGVILQSTSVTVKNGSTAYDVVKQACSNNGVTINAKKSTYGMYIVGFNNIDEKDCGSASGWLYYVNGSAPNKSCDKYTVKNGDNIVFSYTC